MAVCQSCERTCFSTCSAREVTGCNFAEGVQTNRRVTASGQTVGQWHLAVLAFCQDMRRAAGRDDIRRIGAPLKGTKSSRSQLRTAQTRSSTQRCQILALEYCSGPRVLRSNENSA